MGAARAAPGSVLGAKQARDDGGHHAAQHGRDVQAYEIVSRHHARVVGRRGHRWVETVGESYGDMHL